MIHIRSDTKTIVDRGDTLVEENEDYWYNRVLEEIDPLPEFLMPVKTTAYQDAQVDSVTVRAPAVVYVTKQPAYPVTDESAFELRDDGTETLPTDIQIVVKMVGVWGTGNGWRLMRGMWYVGTTFYYILFYIPIVWTDVNPIWDSTYRSIDRAGQAPIIAPMVPRPSIDIHVGERGLTQEQRRERRRIWRLHRRQIWHPYYYREDEDPDSDSSDDDFASVDEDADAVSRGGHGIGGSGEGRAEA